MKEIPVVILHGWASKLERWQPVIEEFEKAGFRVFLPSLPGFSKEEKIFEPWSISSYTDWLKEYLVAKKIKNYLLLGHSFGGRVAINLACQNPKELTGLVLVNSGGIRPSLSLKKVIFFILAKTGKTICLLPPFCLFKKPARFLLYKLAKEKDYYQASPVMKKTLQKAISYDQKKELKKIKKPTLILWGAKDKDTPLSDGRLMNKKIKNSQFIIFPDASHGLPFQKTNRMISEILEFVKCL